MKPYEIIAGPIDVWVAPVGETMPNVNATPAGNWVKLGTSGSKNITEDGLTISHPQSLEFFRMLGSTGPVKAARTEEDLMISFTLADLTLEQYKHALNGGTVTSVAAASGVAGYKHLPLRRGADITERAMLVRGPSPAMANGNMQYEIPLVINSGEPEIVFVKDEPAGILMEWTVMEDPDAASDSLRFGRIVVQTSDAV